MKNTGFTLVELMVMIAVLAISVAMAAPSFAELAGNARLGAVAGDMVTLLKYARTEAMRRGDKLEISPLGSNTQSNQWGDGLRVWFDQDKDGIYDSEEELRMVSVAQDNIDISVTNEYAFSFKRVSQKRDHPKNPALIFPPSDLNSLLRKNIS